MAKKNVMVDESGKRHLRHTDSHRTCYRCGKFKTNASYTWRANGTPFSACKDCNREMARERRASKSPAAAKEA